MSTSDPGTETVVNLEDKAEGAKNSNSLTVLPDLEVIAKLANEFFAALPSQTANPASAPSSGIETRALPVRGVSMPNIPSVPAGAGAFTPTAQPTPLPLIEREQAGSFTSLPTYPSPAELFTFPRIPGSDQTANVPELPPPAPLLNQTDFNAIPASLVDAPLRPTAFATASPPALPGAPAYFLAAPASSPFSSETKFPHELFSFSTPPGAQETTGIPSSLAKPPVVAGREPDLSEPTSTYSLPTHSVDQPKPSAPTTAEPRLDSFDFRPEIVPNIGLSKRLFDPHVIKRDFPILQERVHGRPLIWLDNAATTQKPNAVIDRLTSFYRHENSNIHRAAHALAARATDAYEGAREKVRRFLNAGSTREIIFVRGATEGINLVAKSWGNRNIQKDDEIVITWLEHHANIVPWQQLAAEKGARLRLAPVDDTGQIILEEFEKLLGPRTRIVAFSQVSNALGTVTPAKQMIEMAHRHGARVLVDAAQSVAHMATDVQALDCDFLVFSGHKIFAPTGVGVVFGKADLLETTPPWQGGGNMIVDVTFEKTIYSEPPARFEAGTGTIADAVGLGAALEYLDEIGMANISEYEHELVQYGTAGLLTVPGLRLIGTAREKASVLSFVLDKIPPEEVGKALDQEGIAVRSGHHCAQPILRRFGVERTVRPSLALYNTREDIDALVDALLRIQSGHGSYHI